jgi:probable phosphoglycerate mutase
MLLLLVRHALTPITGKRLTGRMGGFHLSEEGRSQAAAVAGRLAKFPFAAIYSSPLERCQETAQEIASHHRLKVATNKDLSEVDYGQWQGKTFKVLYRSKGWAELRARPGDFRFPGGETVREAQTRGVSAIEELRARHAGKVVAAVSHADLIRLIVAAYLGLGLDLYNRMTIGPATVSAMWLGDKQDSIPRLLRLSDSGSLDDIIERFETAKAQKASANGRPSSARTASGNGRKPATARKVPAKR